MARPLMLSNNRMLVGINHYGLVHDFYYPYVGLENHVAGPHLRHKVGVWVDDTFSWLDDGSWKLELKYEDEALIGHTTARSDMLGVTLELTDFVDETYNVLCRRITLKNDTPSRREIRLFLHQVFQISESSRGDTALFIPDDNVILDYKGNRALVIYAQNEDGAPFDQYAIGNFGIEGKEGTFRDAEDGELAGNAIEHGHVDSVVRLTSVLEGNESKRFEYWIAAAANNVEALDLHATVKKRGLEHLYEHTRDHWQDWLGRGMRRADIDEQFRAQFAQSLLIIKSHTDKRGAVIASGDSRMLNYARDYYSYCWPRDAAYVLWPLIRLGYSDEAKAYFEFARDVLHKDGYLMHKYLPDRTIGSSWHPYVYKHHRELPIQEDETAITILLLGEYLKEIKDEDFVRALYPTLVRPAANFMDNFIDSATKLPHASYDLWEEKFLTTTYSVGAVYAALRTAAQLADTFEHPDDAIRWQSVADDIRVHARDALFNHEKNYFYKGFLLGENDMLEYDDTIDVSSLYGAVMFELYDLDDELVKKAIQTLETELVSASPAGGLPRYEYDNYNKCEDHPHKGNPWFVATLWYGQYWLKNGKAERAREYLNWTLEQMLPSGVLPEQIDPENGKHISVAPLIWSHAEFIQTVLDLSEK